jgi:hypothetical protein
MNLILPVAGNSSRFDGLPPKWLLSHPNGNIMIVEAIKGLNLSKITSIYLITIKEHVDRYDFIEVVNNQFESINCLEKLKIVILDSSTSSQPETVANAIKTENIAGQIYIKDCDNYFLESRVSGNFVSTYDLNNMDLVRARNKSFVIVNDEGFLVNIVEKRVVSSEFNVGGYGFESASVFLNYYEKLSDHSDLYISHIIYNMIVDGYYFHNSLVESYIDWGTLKDWNLFKSKYITLFVSIDGVLIESLDQFTSPVLSGARGIDDNISVINELYSGGKAHIILITSRRIETMVKTEMELKSKGILYNQILYGLNSGKNVLISSYSRSNPYKGCEAVNLKKNTSSLREMLEDSIEPSF